MAPNDRAEDSGHSSSVASSTPPSLSGGDIYYVSQANLNVVIWIGLCLGAFFTALRTWLQYAHNRRFYINDYLIVLAWVFQLVMSILWTLLGPPMYEFEPVDVGLTMPKPGRIYYYNYFLRLEFVILIFWWTQLWLVKLALLTFFWRLFDSVRTHARMFWWIMLFVTISTWTVAIFLHIFSCLPVGSFFRLGGCMARGNVYRSRLTFRFGSITDILTDFFIMLVPFALLRKLQVSSTQKGILILIFLTPLFPIIFAILRLVKTDTKNGFVDPIRIVLFSTVESTFSIIAASLPSIRLFFIHKKTTSDVEYQTYKDYQHKQTSSHDSWDKSTEPAYSLELSHVAEAFGAQGSIGPIEPILDPPKDIHVRKDVTVRRYGM